MHPGKFWAQRAILILTLACSCAAAQSVGDSSPWLAEPDNAGESTDLAKVVVTGSKTLTIHQ
jgi:hypothetical protein